MTEELEEYERNKALFLDQMKSIRPDLFFPTEWSSEQKEAVSQMVRPANIRTSLFSSIPLRCKGPQCTFAAICPLQQKDMAPVSYACPLEMGMVQQFMAEYMQELGVDPTNLIEVSMVRDIVDQEIQQTRTTWLLSMEDFIQENTIGVSNQGDVIYRKEMHLAVELQDKIHRRKRDLRNQLLATREARAKVGQGNLDTAQSISKALESIREVERIKQKALRKRLGMEDFDDYIDAEEVQEDQESKEL